MLIVHWNEDREGCVVATWFDHDNAQRGGFIESMLPADDWWERASARREAECAALSSSSETDPLLSETASGAAEFMARWASGSAQIPMLQGEHS